MRKWLAFVLIFTLVKGVHAYHEDQVKQERAEQVREAKQHQAAYDRQMEVLNDLLVSTR